MSTRSRFLRIQFIGGWIFSSFGSRWSEDFVFIILRIPSIPGEELRQRCSISREEVRATAPLPDGRPLLAATATRVSCVRPATATAAMDDGCRCWRYRRSNASRCMSIYMQAVNRSRIRNKSMSRGLSSALVQAGHGLDRTLRAQAHARHRWKIKKHLIN